MARVIKWSVVINIAMTIALCGAYVTTITDLDRLVHTPIGAPFVQVLYDATDSKAGTSVMAAIATVELISAAISEGACASR